MLSNASWSQSVAFSTISGCSLSQQGTHSRVVFALSGHAAYHLLHLHRPERLVIDFQRATLSAALPKIHASPALVKRIRHGAYHHQLRLVLDLKHTPQRVHGFYLSKDKHHPDRLVIDLYGRHTLVSLPAKSVKKSKPLKNPLIRILPPKKVAHTQDVVIVIDPGHGGKDPGAAGLHRTQEKQVVLAIAKALQQLLNQQRGFKAVLTRRGDYFISLRHRLALARRYKADMFIAIHADAFLHQRAHGASVYALSERGATSEAARWLARKENHSELAGASLSDKGSRLRSVLIGLQQTASIGASLQIGGIILNQLRHFTQLHHPHVEQAAFVVLKSPDIPSLLVETGFLSNPYEERRLRTSRYQYQLARAMMQGIKSYFIKRPPRGTLLASS